MLDFEKIYGDKLISVEEALNKINPGDEIVSALAGAEPSSILEKLHTIAPRVKDITIVTCLPMGDYEYFINPAYKEKFKMEGWFYSGGMRKVHKYGHISYIPNHLHLAAVKRLAYRKPDVFIGTAAPMDRNGYLSLSLSVTYEREMIDNAGITIVEVNKNMPRTFGDTIVHITDIDYIVESSNPVPELPYLEPTDKDRQIGKHIADLIDDGSTIQLGIGRIPNAVTVELMHKRDLGVHSEMLTDGMVDLFYAGVITGRKKTLMPGKMVATFALGSRKLYDFIDNNPAVALMKGSWTNNPYVIGKNYKMVSINTTLEVDLTGQCCSESIGHRQFSGTGGQADTAKGAQYSEGGKSIIALYSTAEVKNEDGNGKKTISKIVTTLTPGAAVSLSRNDVDYVVTEYGVAELRGAPIRERVKRLIKLAHPEFREKLEWEARKLMIW
jgi:acyl-CoA hydrolase